MASPLSITREEEKIKKRNSLKKAKWENEYSAIHLTNIFALDGYFLSINFRKNL
jgi:hypothetical protein